MNDCWLLLFKKSVFNDLVIEKWFEEQFCSQLSKLRPHDEAKRDKRGKDQGVTFTTDLS